MRFGLAILSVALVAMLTGCDSGCQSCHAQHEDDNDAPLTTNCANGHCTVSIPNGHPLPANLTNVPADGKWHVVSTTTTQTGNIIGAGPYMGQSTTIPLVYTANDIMPTTTAIQIPAPEAIVTASNEGTLLSPPHDAVIPSPTAPLNGPIIEDDGAVAAIVHIAAPMKRAVLVGINRFLNAGAPTLAGCVNDARNIKARAIARWGFKAENIILLEDEQATVANVRKALAEAVSASAIGDEILYWQSSHGATDSDAAGDLVCLVCCYDFDWDAEHELTSVDFKAIFSAKAKGVKVRWGSDSCHSGNLDRNFAKHKKPIKVKSVTPPEHVRIRVAKARINGKKARAVNEGLLDVGFISGCKADQTSADSSDDNGVPCGAFTNVFLEDVDALENAPITALTAKIDADLEAQGYDQTPESGGAQAGEGWKTP